MVDNKVISHLDILEKDENDKTIITNTDVYNLGPETKYIGALQASNNNNFDEFFLLGTDKITSIQTDEETNRNKETIEFRRSNDEGYYYKIEKEKYTEINDDIKVESISGIYTLTFENENDMNYDSTNERLVQNADNVYVYIDEGTFNIEGFTDKEDWILKYIIDNTLNPTEVSEKHITKLHRVQNGVPGIVTTESIINKL